MYYRYLPVIHSSVSVRADCAANNITLPEEKSVELFLSYNAQKTFIDALSASIDMVEWSWMTSSSRHDSGLSVPDSGSLSTFTERQTSDASNVNGERNVNDVTSGYLDLLYLPKSASSCTIRCCTGTREFDIYR